MLEKVLGIVVPFAAFALLAFAIDFVGNPTASLVGTTSALLAFVAHINFWLWARCRRWPVVQGTFRTGELRTGSVTSRELQIEYTFAGETFLRPAQSHGAAGASVAIRVNPAAPNLSSLDRPAPRAWITVYVFAVVLLISILVWVATAAQQGAAADGRQFGCCTACGAGIRPVGS